MKLKDCKPKVRQVLEQVPESRDNDQVLIKEILIRHCRQYLVKDRNMAQRPDGTYEDEYYINLKYLQYLPSFETIRRSRQIIQNHPKNPQFLPTTEAVRKARKIKEQNWRDAEVREANKI